MFEIVTLIGFVLAITAHMSSRRTAERLETELAAIKAELARLQESGIPPVIPAGETGAETSAAELPIAALVAETAEPENPALEEAASAGPWDKTTEPAAVDAAIPQPKESLESRLGARWAVWVGGVALALGGVFMVRYSIEAGLLSPGVRLVLAAIFGLLLAAAGEIIRRRALSPDRAKTGQFDNAMIPGILTAAGAVTLFGAVYAAHGIYGFIGAGPAFLLLGLVSLATVALSLLHGQALAGLGLLASMLTPALVSSESPKPWVLFAYLAVAWLATLFAARLRRWSIVPAIGNIGLCLWSLVYIAASNPFDVGPIVFAMLVMTAGVGLVWPAAEPLREVALPSPLRGAGARRADEGVLPLAPSQSAPSSGPEGHLLPAGEKGDPVATPPDSSPLLHDAEPALAATDQSQGQPDAIAEETPLATPPSDTLGWRSALQPPFAAITVTAALSAMLTVIAMIGPLFTSSGHTVAGFIAIVAALAALGAVRENAVYAAFGAALAAVLGFASITSLDDLAMMAYPDLGLSVVSESAVLAQPAAFLLSACFVILTAVALFLRAGSRPVLAILWSAIGASVPAILIATSLIMTGNLFFDARHGIAALLFGVAFLGLAEGFSRRNVEQRCLVWSHAFLLAGSLAQFVIALHALTDGLATTVGVAVLGALYVAALRVRAWRALPWMMVGAALVVLARIAWDPTIVGAAQLGRTPVFNALLPGYGIPALLLVGCAYALRNASDFRVRNLLQALASLFVLLTAAILVRHAMNNGVLDSAVPTLAEQSIYTLLAIGASGIFMSLDLRSPSPIFRYGGMAVGVWSMISVLSAHLFALNPYFTGERLGRFPVVDLLLIGYLLPGIGYAALARYARHRRPMPYVMALAISGVVLIFAWATLSVRRFWQGETIANWNGFLQGETYTYSVVWLLLGVILLAVGSRYYAKSIRITSAVLVFLAVLKVFLIDMANLEGFLRALSFIGLGAVLIGIGLFYQRILSGKAATTTPAESSP
ncbi:MULTISPECIES: DUF2339 domain-containing protein [unclassified Rhizobium]|uniref:DUF2339 domain-containing protein n=1 Tax=unclassified Rhizobium TaxID=2613769 RepID=UPI0006FBFEA4|nr:MULTISPECIES: DUF2339 domain-containing protein [unclassified Rhizobium]KQV43445.1 hypothetical protein ASC86_01110 [Rhizobium sp. Root1212]KRD37631.1 hypothetical protein ASE37_01110 [Rhizobium sp. Root268]